MTRKKRKKGQDEWMFNFPRMIVALELKRGFDGLASHFDKKKGKKKKKNRIIDGTLKGH
ncbi:MAG: hypothetical protein AABX70_01035 [Nanoarchaeota archaeon]